MARFRILCFDKRQGATITIGVDPREGEPEFAVCICIRDQIGCQHTLTSGGTVLVMVEKINRALRLAFDLGPGVSGP